MINGPLYVHAVQDARRSPTQPSARRSLQHRTAETSSVHDFQTPAQTGPLPGLFSPSPPGPFYMSSQPPSSPWVPTPWTDPAACRPFLLQQLIATQAGPQPGRVQTSSKFPKNSSLHPAWAVFQVTEVLM